MTLRAIGVPTGVRRASALRWRSDERLVRLAAAGDDAAFGVLYERHHQALYRYCRSIVRDEHDAQDALQAAMAAAFAGADSWRSGAPVRAWLFRIAHNEAVSLLRRRRRVAALEEAPEPISASAESQVRERQRLATLVADLQDLPERQRAALVMRELSGLGHEEIAAALSTSTATAKQAIFEARIALAEFGEGREMDCDVVRRALSDGDRRVLRGRRIRAHLRDCTVCSRFQTAIPARRVELTALAPPLPAAAAAGLLARLVAGATGTGGLGAQAASMPIVAKVAVGGMVLAAAAGTTERVVRPASPAPPAHTAPARAPVQSVAPATTVLSRTTPALQQTSTQADASSGPHPATRAGKNAKAKRPVAAGRAHTPAAKAKARGRTTAPGSRRAAPATARRATPAVPKAPASRRPATRPSRPRKAKGNAGSRTPPARGRSTVPPVTPSGKPEPGRSAR
jgi:RNA polymerase sigma factor (sigma-70 family)